MCSRKKDCNQCAPVSPLSYVLGPTEKQLIIRIDAWSASSLRVVINCLFLPSTVSVALADMAPAVFWAVQLYTPMSSVFTSTMKNTSSSGITCIRRSRAAGKSVPPSFCQAIWGEGCPTAAHSSRAVVPARMVRSMGILVKEGSTVQQKYR